MVGRGYRFEPFPRAAGTAATTPDEMKVVTAAGDVLGGADAVVHLARQIWWAWPLWLVSYVPGMVPVLRWGYRQVAQRRHCRLRPGLRTLTRRWGA